MQSTLPSSLHIAVIMDGNGRWATRRGLPRHAGHRAGVAALRRVVEAAPALGIATLTVYAFSADNWRRPAAEVAGLMGLVRHYLGTEVARLVRSGVRLTVIGRRDRLPDGMADAIARAEAATAAADGRSLHLRIALDYSARDAIVRAASAVSTAPAASAAPAAHDTGALTRDAFARLLGGGEACRDVDLLIRTSGERRLSDFLLWECAYAELYFTDRLWPDFGADDLKTALHDFQRRDRRFGALPQKGSQKGVRATGVPQGVK